MNILLSLLATTKTGALIEIIIMLLVAGIIAFVTSYYYFKPGYLKRIKKLEDEKSDLEKHVNSLSAENTDLGNEIAELKKKIASKKEKK